MNKKTSKSTKKNPRSRYFGMFLLIGFVANLCLLSWLGKMPESTTWSQGVSHQTNKLAVPHVAGGLYSYAGKTESPAVTYPGSVAVNDSGILYVTDENRILAISPTGECLYKWGSPGTANGQFFSVSDIAINASGFVYAADTGNARIQVFTATGAHAFTWGTAGSEDGSFSLPCGVAINDTGYVFVADTYNHRVQVFYPNGTYLTKWGANGGDGTPGADDGEFNQPTGVAVNGSGYIYVSDQVNARVQVFNPDGTFLSKWGSLGSENGNFTDPNGLTVNETGEVYVADTGNYRIQVFNQTGQFIRTWGSAGESNGLFRLAYKVACNSTGAVFVADEYNYRVQIFDQLGNFIGKYGSTATGVLNRPAGLVVNATGQVYVADTFNHRVQVFNRTGQLINKWGANGGDGSLGLGNGQFWGPAGIALNSSGAVYVVDTTNHRVQIFSQTGQFINKLGQGGSGNGQFSSPMGIAFNGTGDIYVADTYNHRVQVFDKNGGYLFKWGRNGGDGSSGSATGQFNTASGIAINSTGHVFVVDTYNNRIQVFYPNGTYISSIGSYGSSNGNFDAPRGICINATGHIFVADTNNHRIQVFSPDRIFLAKWGADGGAGMAGDGNGQFCNPRAVANGTSQHIYVADTANSRLQVFGNAEPSYASATIMVASPKTNDDLPVNLASYSDSDGDPAQEPRIHWYKNNVYQPGLDGINSLPASWTNKSDKWNASVEAFDGFEYGVPTWTQYVSIVNTAPVAANVVISTPSPRAGDTLNYAYSYCDSDGDSAMVPTIRWFKNGVVQPAYDNVATLPAGVTTEGDQWTVTVAAYDGEEHGTAQSSSPVTIGAGVTTPFPFEWLIIGLAVVVAVLLGIKYVKSRQSRAKK